MHLGQVWQSQGVINLAKLVFVQTLLVKKHDKHWGLSTCCGGKIRAKIEGVIIWAKWAIFMLQQTWPR